MRARQEPRRSTRLVSSPPAGYDTIFTTPWADESSDEDPSYEPSAAEMRNAYDSDDSESSNVVVDTIVESHYTSPSAINPLYSLHSEYDSDISDSSDSDW